jgi:DNA-binding LacI/PurR family transcriptional regulator
MKSPRPTLRSLAAEAGVSAMTISLALRDRPEISAATRRRLQRLARQRGYQPDPTISKLMQHLRMRAPARVTANICGLVEVPAVKGGGRHEFAERVQAGLRRRAEELGYAYDRIEIEAGTSQSRLQNVISSRGVEGIVLLPKPGQADLSHLLDWSHFSVVSVTASVVAPRVHTINPSHYDNMIKACQRLAETGFRRIGLAISRDWDERVRHRWAGAIAWQNAAGGTEPVAPFFSSFAGPVLTDPGFTNWLKRQRPDVVVVEAIDGALLHRAFRALPVRQRPVVATMDWPSEQASLGMDQRPEEIGAVAIDTLAGMIYRGERGIPKRPLNILVDGDWVPADIYCKAPVALPGARAAAFAPHVQRPAEPRIRAPLHGLHRSLPDAHRTNPRRRPLPRRGLQRTPII